MAPTASKVWKYFFKCTDKEVQCRVCNKILKFCKNTTNMLQHLKLKHANEFFSIKGTPTTTCFDDFDNEEKYIDVEKYIDMASTSHNAGVLQNQSDIHSVFLNAYNYDSGSPNNTKPKNKATSKVWKYFSKMNDMEVQCFLCNKILKYCRNTTNMLQHLKLKHTKEFLSLKRTLAACFEDIDDEEKNMEVATTSQNSEPVQKQPKIQVALSKPHSSALGSSKLSKLTKSIVEMIVMDNLPFSHVEGKGFLNMMKEHHPFYKVPTKIAIKAEMEKMYEEEVKNFKKMVSQVSSISLTTDIWTDINLNKMIGVTVHGLFENKQFSATIGVFQLTQDHTADHIVEVLMSSLETFSIIKYQITAVVTNNDANIVKAVYQSFGNSHHISCFAHALNLVCINALETAEASILITKCRNIVVWLKRSGKSKEILHQLQISSGVPEGNALKVILDVKTRWNSTFYMLERFMKLFSYIGQVVVNVSDAPQMMSSVEQDELIEIIALLKPLEAMTTQISGEKYATLSQVIPLTHCGWQQIIKVVCSTVTGSKLKSAILDEFDRRFGSIEQSFLLAASTLLDPRFKKIHFQDSAALASVMKNVRKELSTLSQMDEKLENVSDESSTSEDEFDLWAHHKTLTHKCRKKNNDPSEIQDELTLFLNAPVLELRGNVVNAWDEMRLVYPKLYSIACRYCFLIGTSVPSKHLFSKAGVAAAENRNRLTTSRLSKLLFLNSVLNK